MDQDAPVLAQREKLAPHIIKQLNRRRMAGSYAPTVAEAKAQVLDLIKGPAVVLRAGTQSATTIGLWDDIKAIPGITLLDPYVPGLTPAEALEIRRKGFSADYFLTSSNALTLDGRLVNLDGACSRVAPMLFGPAKVILLIGMNKIVADLDAAYARVRSVAAPANNQRLAAAYNLKNPCIEDGRCHQCASETRICNA